MTCPDSASRLGIVEFEKHASGVRTLPELESWSRLRSKAVARLAITGPDIFPVNFLVADHEVFIRTSDGTKADTLREHPQVALETDDLGPHPWSVVVKGVADVIDDPDEIASLGELAFWSWAPRDTDVIVRIRPTEITGRQFTH